MNVSRAVAVSVNGLCCITVERAPVRSHSRSAQPDRPATARRSRPAAACQDTRGTRSAAPGQPADRVVADRPGSGDDLVRPAQPHPDSEPHCPGAADPWDHRAGPRRDAGAPQGTPEGRSKSAAVKRDAKTWKDWRVGLIGLGFLLACVYVISALAVRGLSN